MSPRQNKEKPENPEDYRTRGLAVEKQDLPRRLVTFATSFCNLPSVTYLLYLVLRTVFSLKDIDCIAGRERQCEVIEPQSEASPRLG